MVEPDRPRVGAAALAVTAALGGGHIFFVRRVRALAEGTRQVAAGNLAVRIPIRGRDELASLSQSFNEMAAELSLNRRQAEEGAAQLRAIFDSTTEGIVISDPDTGQVVELNPAMSGLLGYSREGLLGTPPSSFLDPHDREAFAAMIPEALSGAGFRRQAGLIRQDGSRVVAEVRATAVQYGGRSHVLSTFLDVTERVEGARILEERVMERTSEVAALLDTATALASSLDFSAVMQTVLRQAEAAIGFDAATILTVDGDDAFVASAMFAGGNSVPEMTGFRVHLGAALEGFISG